MPVNLSNIPFTKCNWEEQHPNAEETIPYDMPEPLGKLVKITVFCDASHADCLVTRQSTTGILIFVNGTPIRWYSKRQNTVESRSEMLLALRTTLRMLGVPLDGPPDVFWTDDFGGQFTSDECERLRMCHQSSPCEAFKYFNKL